MLTLILAQAPVDDMESNIWVDLLVNWGPFFVIAFIIYIFVFRNLRKYNHSVVEDAMAHSKRMDAKTDEVIALLRSIDEKLDRND